jgi:DNA-binding response OmpR family regulator
MTRVLIAEDDTPIRSMLDDFLSGEGFDTLLAENGRVAIDLALAEQPDVVLMDMMLPVIDGLSAIRQLRQEGSDYAPRIIAMSANPTLLSPTLRLPVDATVPKPFDLEVLLHVIQARNTTEPRWLSAAR